MSETVQELVREELRAAMQHGAMALQTVARRSEDQGYPYCAAFYSRQARILEAALADPAAPAAPEAEPKKCYYPECWRPATHYRRGYPICDEHTAVQVALEAYEGRHPTPEEKERAQRAIQIADAPPPAARQPEAERERSEMFRTHALDAVERLMEQGWAGPNPDSSDNLSEGADVVQDAIDAARQPGVDAELVRQLRYHARAIARLSAPAGPGSEGGEVERLREALERIVRWSEAYPVDIFPEPDLKTARVLLEAGGITLDAVSASAMRHVVNGVGQIARAALEASGADHHDAGTGET